MYRVLSSMINPRLLKDGWRHPPAWSMVVALIVSFAGNSSRAQVHYQDNFDRADSLNDLGSATGGAWILNRDPDNGGNPYNTNGALGPDVQIRNSQLLINCGGQNAGAPVNNNDMASFYVNFNLDTTKEYSVTFDYTQLNAHAFDETQAGSQANGGFFLLPRAQGEDLPGNFGYVIRRTTAPLAVSPLAVYFYSGTGRAGDPATTANIPLADLGTALDTSLVSDFTVDQSLSIRLDVYGPTGNLAKLIIGGLLVDQDRDIGSNYNNATPDHVVLGYNSLGTAQRRHEATIDNLLVSDVLRLGDTNGNGIVEYPEDFDPIRLNFRKPVTMRSQGDLTSDGVVDFADFREWTNAYVAGGGSLADLSLVLLPNVPEPSSLSLLLVAVVCSFCVTYRAANRWCREPSGVCREEILSDLRFLA